MRTLYAIALICLSVPAFAAEDFGGLAYKDATETGYLYDTGADFFHDDNTATIITPAMPKMEDQSVAAVDAGYLHGAGAEFNVRDENTTTEFGLFTTEDWTYQGDAVDLDAFPADDWF